MVKLASNGYAGSNHSHFSELLREREGIDLSRPTVRRILVKAGIGSPRSRRSQQHRFRRKRMPHEGMLIQVDGSPHAWLEERADKFVLLLAVDDATGTVAQAVFPTTEDTRGYLVLLEGLVQQRGIPLALYSDRHAAFKYNAHQGPSQYESTQLARVMRELGIQQIFAMSPQAKEPVSEGGKGTCLRPEPRSIALFEASGSDKRSGGNKNRLAVRVGDHGMSMVCRLSYG